MKFSVNPIGTTIRPGDDFLLRFGLAANPSICGTAGEGAFMAVYNKKLLWRANLFINEKYDWETQKYKEAIKDWNDINPWISDNNEWKEVTDYETLLSNIWNNVPDTTIPKKSFDGKQIYIIPWTHPYTTPSEKTIKGSVGYSWGGPDDVVSFNDKIYLQGKQLFNNDNTHKTTEAPDNYWFKYSKDSYLPTLGIYQHVIEHDSYDTGKNIFTPTTKEDREKFKNVLKSKEAGLDCIGFIKKSMYYSNNIYKDYGNFWPVGQESKDYQDYEYTGEINCLVPGDLIHMDGYIGFVASIKYKENVENKNAIIEEIIILESTTYDNYWMVQRKQTPVSYVPREENVRFERLMIDK
jgi:hypothetical protein